MSFISDIWHKVWDVLKTIIAVAAIIFVLVVAWYAVMMAAGYGAVAEAALGAILPAAAAATVASFAALAVQYPIAAAFAAFAVVTIASPSSGEAVVKSLVNAANDVVDGLVDVAKHVVSAAASGIGWWLLAAVALFTFSRGSSRKEGGMYVRA